MKLHGICLVKNEADIIERSLRHSAQYFDHIYVFDNGSTDDTWKIVQELSREVPEVVPFASEDRDFRDGLRSIPFQHYREQASKGDWWCRLDADEIYPDDPKEFLSKVPRRHQVVWSLHLQFYFSEVDLDPWRDRENPPEPCPDFSDLPKRYLANASEPRFFRHRPRLKWNEDQAWPEHLGLIHPRRIPVKHYQWRNPEQIQTRLATRKEAADRGYKTFGHSLDRNWENTIRESQQLHQDFGKGEWKVSEVDLPNHLEPFSTRAGKLILHGLGIWP